MTRLDLSRLVGPILGRVSDFSAAAEGIFGSASAKVVGADMRDKTVRIRRVADRCARMRRIMADRSPLIRAHPNRRRR